MWTFSHSLPWSHLGVNHQLELLHFWSLNQLSSYEMQRDILLVNRNGATTWSGPGERLSYSFKHLFYYHYIDIFLSSSFYWDHFPVVRAVCIGGGIYQHSLNYLLLLTAVIDHWWILFSCQEVLSVFVCVYTCAHEPIIKRHISGFLTQW